MYYQLSFQLGVKPIQNDFQHDFAPMTDEAVSSVLLAELGVRGTKSCSSGPGHMTNMAAITIYRKNITKSSSLGPIPVSLETWYVAVSKQGLARLFKL